MNEDDLLGWWIGDIKQKYGAYTPSVAESFINSEIASINFLFNHMPDSFEEFFHLPDTMPRALPERFILFVDFMGDSSPFCERFGINDNIRAAGKALTNHSLYLHWVILSTPEWRVQIGEDGTRAWFDEKGRFTHFTESPPDASRENIAACLDIAKPVIEAYKAAMLDIIEMQPPDAILDKIAKEGVYLYPYDPITGRYRARISLRQGFKDKVFKDVPLSVCVKLLSHKDGRIPPEKTIRDYYPGNLD